MTDKTPPATTRAAPGTHPGAAARHHRARWSRDDTDCIRDAPSTRTLPNSGTATERVQAGAVGSVLRLGCVAGVRCGP